MLYLYKLNTFNLYEKNIEKQRKSDVVIVDHKISETDRQRIRSTVADQTSNKYKKSGFISIPSLGILMPIFNDANNSDGLKIGASRTNSDEVPIEYQSFSDGNQVLAGHNYNDGKTAFGPLQQRVSSDKEYVENGQYKSNYWLNENVVYLADSKYIYQFQISGQRIVNGDDLSVLKQTALPKLTLITCLYPDDTKRIITTANFIKKSDWKNAKDLEVGYFDLNKQKENI